MSNIKVLEIDPGVIARGYALFMAGLTMSLQKNAEANPGNKDAVTAVAATMLCVLGTEVACQANNPQLIADTLKLAVDAFVKSGMTIDELVVSQSEIRASAETKMKEMGVDLESLCDCPDCQKRRQGDKPPKNKIDALFGTEDDDEEA